MASASSSAALVASCTCRSTSSLSIPKFQLLKSFPYSPFSSWNGLKQLCISKSQQHIGRSRKHKGKGVYASLFGVGAPEALVIGVVALLVFGPKGLAEVARNLGKTLRAFQPTIRELQDVSREFKSTLEREIGLDDLKGSVQDPIRASTTTTTKQEVDPNGSPSSSTPSSREEDMERLMKIAAAEEQAEIDMASVVESQSESQNESQDHGDYATADTSAPEGAYSSEELLKITEEQLKAAAQQQSETSTQQSPSNTQNQFQETPEAAQVIPSSQKSESEK